MPVFQSTALQPSCGRATADSSLKHDTLRVAVMCLSADATCSDLHVSLYSSGMVPCMHVKQSKAQEPH